MECSFCSHRAELVVYRGKGRGLLMCRCCFGGAWNFMEKSPDPYTVVPLALTGFVRLYRRLAMDVEGIFTEEVCRAAYRESSDS